MLKNYKLLIATLAFALFSATCFAQEWIYTTRPGDNLWNISKQYLKSVSYYSRLQKHNSVGIATQMAPGTRLRIPIAWLKQQPSPAVLVAIFGDVSYRAKGNATTQKKATARQKLYIGDTLYTGSNGSVSIQFADGSLLLLQKQSELNFDVLSSFGTTGMVDTQIRLQKGRLETSAKPAKGAASRFEIRTPAAVAAVRGTQFRVGFDKGKDLMASEVVEGKVGVQNSGNELNVPAGFGTIAETGKAPLPPKKLLPPPQLQELPEKIRRLPYTMPWPDLQAANTYRVQIAPAGQANILVLDVIVNQPQVLLSDLENGLYTLRVRGIDDISLEGFDAVHRFEVNTDFAVPALIAPQPDSVHYDGRMDFQWQVFSDAASYRFQVSNQQDFSVPLVDRVEKEGSAKAAQSLSPGDYYWRVAGVDKEGYSGKFSIPIKFSVRELPAVPQPAVQVAVDDSRQSSVTIEWPMIENSNFYVIQIAKDGDFTRLAVEERVTTASYTLTNTLTPGDYYVRAQSEVNSEAKSAFSSALKFTVPEPAKQPTWLLLLLLIPVLM